MVKNKYRKENEQEIRMLKYNLILLYFIYLLELLSFCLIVLPQLCMQIQLFIERLVNRFFSSLLSILSLRSRWAPC